MTHGIQRVRARQGRQPHLSTARLIEAQLKRVSEAAGVPYDDPAEGMPPEVVELVEKGDRLGAIKLYRELTGGSVDDAREVVDGM
jgi:hypothetical protein